MLKTEYIDKGAVRRKEEGGKILMLNLQKKAKKKKVSGIVDVCVNVL